MKKFSFTLQKSPRVFTYNSGVYFTVSTQQYIEYNTFLKENREYLIERSIFVAWRPSMGLRPKYRSLPYDCAALKYVSFLGLQVGYSDSYESCSAKVD